MNSFLLHCTLVFDSENYIKHPEVPLSLTMLRYEEV